MNTTNDTAPKTADTIGSSLPPAADYSIAPEDRELADRIANFDPLRDVPSPASYTGGSRKPIDGPLKATMLPPELRQHIEGKLRDVPLNLRESRENELVRETLHQQALELRIKAGAGKDANAFVKERFQIAAERNQAQREIRRLTEQLAEVERWVPVHDEITGAKVIDPETGQQKFTAVTTLTGERRVAVERQIAALEYAIQLLDGPEGDLRERKALHQAVEAEKAQRDQIAIEHEARAKADEIIRQEQIAAKAEAYAKGRRNRL